MGDRAEGRETAMDQERLAGLGGRPAFLDFLDNLHFELFSHEVEFELRFVSCYIGVVFQVTPR